MLLQFYPLLAIVFFYNCCCAFPMTLSQLTGTTIITFYVLFVRKGNNKETFKGLFDLTITQFKSSIGWYESSNTSTVIYSLDSGDSGIYVNHIHCQLAF